MKQKRTILFFLCVLLLSAGCSRAVKEEEVLEVSTDEAGPEAADEGEGTAEEARRAFGEVLWNVYFKGVVPDGEKLDYTGTESVQENLFTVMDVDGDGQEELLLFWVNAFMGGQNCFIFGYRDGAVYEELRAFPLLTFYDNGMIKADWSHNHNLGLDFWPYHVYRYDEESGAYQYAGGVDTWDRSVREENWEGEPFPEEIDVDGDGLVYFLLPADWDGQYDMTPVDEADYEAWRDTCFAGAEELLVPSENLTEENIEALGCPRPDMEIPEPAG